MRKVLKRGRGFLLFSVLFYLLTCSVVAADLDNSDKLTDMTDVTVSEEGEETLTDITETDKNDIDNGTEEIVEETVINKKSLSRAKIQIEKNRYIYDAKRKTPEVTVKLDGVTLAKGTDYEVIYSNNKNVGNAKITINGKGNYEGTVTTKFKIVLGSTSVVSSSTVSRIKLKWDIVPGADAYQIYRSTSQDSGYKKIATIDASEVVYYDRNIVFNEIYYYKVRAYYEKGENRYYGEFSAPRKQQSKVATAVITKLTRNSSTSIQVNWDQVGGASGYAVYRSVSEDGTYEKIGAVKGKETTSFIDKNCTCGKTYYYKVAAYKTANGKNCYGNKSKPVSGYAKPDKAQFNDSTSFETTSITLKWNKVTYASGYRIYRSTSKDGTYTAIATVESGNTLTWKDTGLDKTKTYYYKVRAYVNIDGKNVWGTASSAIKKASGEWKYVNGYKLFYNGSGKLVKDVSGIIGKQSSYVIKINKKMNTVTVYAKDGDKGYIIPVKAFVCSTGYATPTGTFYTPAKWRWGELMGPCWGQWITQITGDFLFHSVYYNSYNNNNTLAVGEYNKLGTTASHGCVRLTAGDAKWIYDNCKVKTKVIIYNDSNAGPLGKPSAAKLPYWHTWDPTDPNMYYKCESRGCH